MAAKDQTELLRQAIALSMLEKPRENKETDQRVIERMILKRILNKREG